MGIFKKFKKDNKGISIIALAVTVGVMFILAVMVSSTLKEDDGALKQVNVAKIEVLESTAREQVNNGVSALRFEIASLIASNRNYKANEHAGEIQDKLIQVLNNEISSLNGVFDYGDGKVTGTSSEITVGYTGQDYQGACKNSSAKIVYTISLTDRGISVSGEINATLKDQNGEDFEIEVFVVEPGLYDEDNKILATWDELVNTYGMNITKTYSSGSYKSDMQTPYQVFKNNENLKKGTNLIIGKDVTSIGKFAFTKCSNLESVTISNSIISMGEYAFVECTNLKRVEFEKNCKLTTLAGSLFQECTSLKDITIPDSITRIEGWAFSECTALEKINIPSGITIINDRTFKDCTSLKSVAFADDSQLKTIGYYAFWKCASLNNIKIPNSVTKISQGAFKECTGIISVGKIGSGASVEIPDGVDVSDSEIFRGCTGIVEVDIPDNITKFGYNAFYGCTGLKKVSLPASVTEITASEFYGCTELTSVIFDENSKINYIRSSAFEGCTSLESITIPAGVTNIGGYVFKNCTSLANVVLKNTKPSTLGLSIFDGCNMLATIVVPKDTSSTYKSHADWSEYASKIVEATE